jgi:hypothetical protein
MPYQSRKNAKYISMKKYFNEWHLEKSGRREDKK